MRGGGGKSTLVAEGELRNGLEAEHVADTRDQVLRVGLLQARGAAVQAKLADEAILLDHADRQRGVVRGAAELLLNADEGALATAEDEDLIQVDGVVAANGGGPEELRGRHVFLWTKSANCNSQLSARSSNKNPTTAIFA